MEFREVRRSDITNKITQIIIDQLNARGINFFELPPETRQELDADGLITVSCRIAEIIENFLKKLPQPQL